MSRGVHGTPFVSCPGQSVRFVQVFPLLVVVLAVGLLASPATLAGQPVEVPGKAIVRFEAGADARARNAALDSTDARVQRRLSIRGARVLELERGQSVRAAVRQLERQPGVAWAEPVMVQRVHGVSNDTFFSEQWSLHSFGQLVGAFRNATADVDVDAPEAWDVTTGDSSVLVAVVDSGVALSHPDLAPNIPANPGETGSGKDTNGVDDDGNGFVDDVRGWDFIDDDNDASDPAIGLNHGSVVASTIGARGGDSQGISGVVHRVGLLPIRVAGTDGTLTTVDAAEAFVYAASRGAKIVNASFGGFGVSQLELDAINQAPNTLFVASSGNDAVDTDTDPVSPCVLDAPNIVCVAASDLDDALADFSNFGAETVDLSGPGVAILGAQQPYANLFSEGFETDLSAWVTGGSGGTWARTSAVKHMGDFTLTDSPAGNYANNADHFIRTASAVDLSGQDRCRLDYFLRFQAEGGPGDFIDGLITEAATDASGPWTELSRWSGTSSGRFLSVADDLASFVGSSSVYVRFRFVSDASVVFDGIHIDNALVQCTSAQSVTGRDFAYGDGTSFSAPIVAGVGALALSVAPELSVADLRSVLLAGVDPVQALVGKTVTGGRTNALAALRSIPPTARLGSATAAGGEPTLTLRGVARPHGQSANAYFEYGESSASLVATEPIAIPETLGDQPVALTLRGLAPDTRYVYRLVVESAGGVARTGLGDVTTNGSGPRSGIAPVAPSPLDVTLRSTARGAILRIQTPVSGSLIPVVRASGRALRAVSEKTLSAGTTDVSLGRLRAGSEVLLAFVQADGQASYGQANMPRRRRGSSSAVRTRAAPTAHAVRPQEAVSRDPRTASRDPFRILAPLALASGGGSPDFDLPPSAQTPEPSEPQTIPIDCDAGGCSERVREQCRIVVGQGCVPIQGQQVTCSKGLCSDGLWDSEAKPGFAPAFEDDGTKNCSKPFPQGCRLMTPAGANVQLKLAADMENNGGAAVFEGLINAYKKGFPKVGEFDIFGWVDAKGQAEKVRDQVNNKSAMVPKNSPQAPYAYNGANLRKPKSSKPGSQGIAAADVSQAATTLVRRPRVPALGRLATGSVSRRAARRIRALAVALGRTWSLRRAFSRSLEARSSAAQKDQRIAAERHGLAARFYARELAAQLRAQIPLRVAAGRTLRAGNRRMSLARAKRLVRKVQRRLPRRLQRRLRQFGVSRAQFRSTLAAIKPRQMSLRRPGDYGSRGRLRALRAEAKTLETFALTGAP